MVAKKSPPNDSPPRSVSFVVSQKHDRSTSAAVYEEAQTPISRSSALKFMLVFTPLELQTQEVSQKVPLTAFPKA